MDTAIEDSVRRLGFFSAVGCTLLSLTYIVAQLLEWAGWFGSEGGPQSRSTSLGLTILLTPSLLLGLSYVVLMVSLHYCTEASRRIWSHLALVFASIYATLTGIVYYVQLAFVMPRLSRVEEEQIQLLVFEPFNSWLYAVDVYGYGLMCLSTLFAAGIFRTAGIEGWIRLMLLANGCLIPFLTLQMFYPPLIWGGSLWAITFPTATGLIALRLRQRSTTTPELKTETRL